MTVSRWFRTNNIDVKKTNKDLVAVYHPFRVTVQYNIERIREEASRYSIPFRWMLILCLAHEMVHAKQDMEGRLFEKPRWEIESEAWTESLKYMDRYPTTTVQYSGRLV